MNMSGRATWNMAGRGGVRCAYSRQSGHHIEAAPQRTVQVFPHQPRDTVTNLRQCM